jgi:predicted DNA-binding transcriptional regulator AlpA
MQRTIHGPEKEWLDLTDVLLWIGVSEGTLRRWIRDKQFPPGVNVGGKSLKWGWLDVVAFMHLRSRIPGEGDGTPVDDEAKK